VQHHLEVRSVGDIDEQVRSWLRAAYDPAGSLEDAAVAVDCVTQARCSTGHDVTRPEAPISVPPSASEHPLDQHR
jgi:hypothetical protein